jgi:serine/threonine protein kinase
MRICTSCYRIFSDKASKCLYCKSADFKEPLFQTGTISSNYKIYASDIVVDDQAYTIVKPLGKGGFGTVLKVFDPIDNKYYAMKVPLIFDEVCSNNKANREENIEASQKYLENEINTILKFVDDTFLYVYKKGAARVSSKGKELEFPVFVMELAEGTVSDLIKLESEGSIRLSFEEKNKILRETVNTISHLHDMNVLHRDLSPDNIFIVDRGGRITYVLGDFGTSKRLYETNAAGKSTQIVGHSAYLDPLRFEEKFRYDFRVDLYSLGIICVEILLGNSWTKILGEENISHLLAMDFEKEFLCTEGAKYIRKDILEVLKRAVKRNPEERYESIGEFRQALFAIMDIDSENITAPLLLTPSSGRPKTPRSEILNLDFYFSVKLPFAVSEKTFAQDIIQYNEQGKIELKNYQGAKIVFSNFSPQKVTLKHTGLYSAVAAESAILLNFKNSEFRNYLAMIDEIKDEVDGELHFKGSIELEGVRT